MKIQQRVLLVIFFVELVITPFLNAQEIPSYWTGDTGIRLIREETDVQDGSSSLIVEINSADEAQCDIRSKEIPVTPGETYHLTFYYNTSAHVRVQAVLEWNGAVTTWASEYGGDGGDDPDYILYSTSGTVPAGAAGVKVGVRFYDQSGFITGELQYIDNIIFESPSGNIVELRNSSFEQWQIRNWKEIIKKLASDGNDENGYGYSVSISGDYAVVGACDGVYILYKFQDGDDNWGEIKKISMIGLSVSISGDYVVAGNATENNMTGAAYIYNRNQDGANDWGLVKRIVASDSSETSLYGYSVSMDGNYLIVGAIYEPDDENGNNPLDYAGAAYLYYKDQGSTGNWGQVKKLVASDRGVEQGFGSSVSIDGEIIAVGAIGNSTDESGEYPLPEAGAVYLFMRNYPVADNWGQYKKLVAGDRYEDDHFGLSVSLSDGILAVGAVGQDYNATGGGFLSDAGAVYVYQQNSGGPENWGQVSKIVASDRAEDDEFGSSVSIFNNYLLVGAPYNATDESGSNAINQSGAAYIFFKDHGGLDAWEELNKLVAGNRGEKNRYGISVDLCGNYAIIGAQGNPNFIDGIEGQAYILKLFTQSGTLLFSEVGTDRFTIEWSTGDGDARAVFIREGSGELVFPENNTTYSASTVFGSGSQIGSSGWYCVYNSTGTGVTVTGFQSSTEYTIMVYEYTGSAGSEFYIPFTYSGNPANQYTGSVLSGVTLHVGNGILIGTTTSMQYSLNSTNGTDGNWTDCTGGTTSVIFDEGAVYVREKAVPSNFNLVATIPAAPETPAYTIDYANESTAQSVPGTVEYNEDNNFSTTNINGEGTVVQLTPGTDLYFRVKPTASTLPSDVQHLVVPERPQITSYSINYPDETTVENIGTQIEYSPQSDMTGAQSGNNQPVALVPGTDLYFRVKSTVSSFRSEIYHLDVPSRPPSTTTYTINYMDETTNENVSSTDEYSTSQDFTSAITGADQPVNLIPAIDIYFRGKATAGSFASETQHLVVPDRPAKTTYGINFLNETTKENVDVEDEYSDQPDMAGAQSGENLMLELTPGTTLYIRKQASDVNFSGKIQELIVPPRPAAPVVSLSDKNSQYAVFKKSSDGTGDNVGLADKYEFSTDGGINYIQITDFTMVNATGNKVILVRKMATTFVFASELTGNLDYEKPVATITDITGCNGPDNTITVQSTIDNGKVYIVLDGEPQSDVQELNTAVGSGKGAVVDIISANSDVMMSTSNIQHGNYYAYATNSKDSLSDRSESSVIIYNIPDINLGEDILECDGTEIMLDAGAGYDSYLWSPGEATSQSIMVSEQGEYVATVTDIHGCKNSDTISVLYAKPFQEKICLITIDLLSGKNLIIWEKTPDKGTVAYQIHRQTQVTNVYEQIDSVPYEALSIFKDTVADPEKRQWVYKITTVDTCGNVSDIETAKFHKPLFLQYVSTDDGVNLEWEKYEVQGSEIEFITYEIYRGSDSADLQYIDEVSADLRVYKDTDTDVLNHKYYYRVAGVKSEPCYPSTGKKDLSDEYLRSMSNLEDNKFVSGLPETDHSTNLVIYPNPAKEGAVIRFDNTENLNYCLILRDITGKTVLFKQNNLNSEIILNRDNLKAGYYFVELKGKRIFRGAVIFE